MPRKRNPANEKARLRQERYRARLADRNEPEVAAVDTALSVGVASLMLSPSMPKETILQIGQAAVQSLRNAGYSGQLAGPLVHRRLTWLREVLKNPDADRLTRLGFYEAVKRPPPITPSSANKNVQSHVVTERLHEGLSETMDYDPSDDDPF